MQASDTHRSLLPSMMTLMLFMRQASADDRSQRRMQGVVWGVKQPPLLWGERREEKKRGKGEERKGEEREKKKKKKRGR